MTPTLDPALLQLIHEASIRAYNRKTAFRQFLRRCRVPERLLAMCVESETKRQWMDRLLPVLESSEKGRGIVLEIAKALIAHTSFPDLENYEDSDQRIKQARDAVRALSQHLKHQEVCEEHEREACARRERAAIERQRAAAQRLTLEALRERLDALAQRLGEQRAGYDFQDWFYDLADFFELANRRPYIAGGRQIDGTLTVDGTTYLVELRFRQEPAGSPDIDGLIVKVNSKADNTMAIFVSMAGFNDGGIENASYARTPLLLADFTHLYHCLAGTMDLGELIQRIRRHASQTGEAFLPVHRFGG